MRRPAPRVFDDLTKRDRFLDRFQYSVLFQRRGCVFSPPDLSRIAAAESPSIEPKLPWPMGTKPQRMTWRNAVMNRNPQNYFVKSQNAEVHNGEETGGKKRGQVQITTGIVPVSSRAAHSVNRGFKNDVKIDRGIVLTAKRCRNKAWGFNPRKGPNRTMMSPDKGAGLLRLTR